MECIYSPEISHNNNVVEISGSSAKHLKALHIREDDNILLTNGCGLLAEGRVVRILQDKYLLNIVDLKAINNEHPFRLGLAIGILDNRERLEFCFEKAIELGISDFFPLITDYSQKKKINSERFSAKAISTIEQCKRGRLPTIHNPLNINELLKEADSFANLILLDIAGNRALKLENNKSSLVIIGPEGGFSDKELQTFKQNCRIHFLNLGDRRLRAETAAIVSLGLIVFI